MPPISSFENPKAYNTQASAYSKRVGTASSSISRATLTADAGGSHPYVQMPHAARHRMPSAAVPLASPTYPTQSQVSLESRVYGLTADLREPSTSTATPEVGDPNRMSRLLHGHHHNFSVEVFASSFDPRGYPVLAGRAASVRGVVRMHAAKGCDVMMTISAHTTSGSPAAVWQGTALAPWSSGAEKKVFEINDRLIANYDLVRPRAAYAPKNEELMEPPQKSEDDMVLPIPFDVSLPMGKSTRFVDGELQTVPVSLPPSFEISSKQAAQEKREIRLATKGKSKVPLAKELIEKGFEKVFRVGCYYQITWTLIRDTGSADAKAGKKGGSSSRTAVKEASEGDSLTLPFIFLGEPTSMPPHPPTLPSTISPSVFLDENVALGDRWDIHRSQAKWSGSLLKAARKTVDIELHIPNPPVLQAPSVLPIMVVLRPTDPGLLSAIRTRAASETSTAPGSPAPTQADDPIETIASQTSSPRETDAESIRTSRSIVSKFIKPSMSLARMQSSGPRRGSSSIFGGRRPNTAPSSGSSDTGVTDAMTDRTFVPATGAVPDLVNLVCVSLIQTTFNSNDSVNDGPEHRRKLLSVADLEEVDVHALLLNSEASGSQPGSRPGSGRSPDEMTAIQEAVNAARAAGVRVLVGSLKVFGTTPPSFRCHGLEVKYALKVDLLPANRFAGGEGVEKAFRSLGIGSGGRSRGFSDGSSTTASVHTQTQFTQLSNDGSSPPTTPPWGAGAQSMFGARSPGSDSGPTWRAWTQQNNVGRNGSPGSVATSMQGMGVAFSTHDESAVPADQAERREVLSPSHDHTSRMGAYPNAYPQQQHSVHASGKGSGSVAGGASVRTGWGSGHSISDASQVQSSIYMSEWGRDRKTVSKINKTIGEMWLDVRVVRAFNSY
ncbi:hypothetical protein BCV70DRAFT_154905 [Testicularia cyperi]|uniref:Uncharacterized protein n=1 Tax=Testicularia cyperi TaxID=1882483 RepID=A0A317XZ38_9BASI|nr:hypothetical protein BCV70DRAFT_154905 [Testicularia cyperi]